MNHQKQTKMNTFNNALNTIASQGFNANQTLNIAKRINKHIAYCMDNNQDYDETIFFIEQDFTFDKLTLESIVCDLIIAEPKTEEYFNNK